MIAAVSGSHGEAMRSAIARGDFKEAMERFRDSVKPVEVHLDSDIASAAREPLGQKQWECVDRPDVVASFLTVVGGPDLLLDGCEAAVRWAIRKDQTQDPDLYNFTRELYPFLKRLFDGRPIAEKWGEKANYIRDQANRFIEQASDIDPENESALTSSLQVAIAARWGATGRAWSHMTNHLLKCEDKSSCPINAVLIDQFARCAIDLISGCDLLQQSILARDPEWKSFDGEARIKRLIEVRTGCARAMRRSVPFELMKAHAIGMVAKASGSTEMN